MALTFPADLPAITPMWQPPELLRFQSSNMTGGTSEDVIELAPPLWQQEYDFRARDRAQAGVLSSWKEMMRGGLRLFKGAIPGHRWPLLHPRGFTGWNGLGAIASIAAGRDIVTVSGVQNGTKVSPGDFVSIAVGGRQHLHKILEPATAASGSIALTIEPTLKPNGVVAAVVRFADPYCEMHIRGKPSESGYGPTYRLSFTGLQVAK